MRLANLKEFRRLIYTPDSAPAESTLRAQISRGEIPGGKRHGARYYVDLDEFLRVSAAGSDLHQQHAETSKAPELEGLL
jgi:hypothetical protein